MPIDFDIFLDTLAMCGFHVRFSSRITPKRAVSFTRPTAHWLISTLMSSVCLFCLGLNTIKLVFEINRKLIGLAPVSEVG